MSALNVEEMTIDVYKVRYKTVTSSRFDNTAFKATVQPSLAALSSISF